MGGQLGITHRVLDIAVAQIGLQSPSINGPCWLERTHRQARSTMRAKPAVVKYIARLAAEASLPRNAIAYARQIREFADRRKMLAMIETIGRHSIQPTGGRCRRRRNRNAGRNRNISVRRIDPASLTGRGRQQVA
jgi:hypothetical protein